MTTIASRKAKGRRLQQKIVKILCQVLGIHQNSIKSIPGGVQGQDIWVSDNVRQWMTLAIECKNTEQLNIWKAIEQSETNAGDDQIPVVIFAKNKRNPYIAINLDDFMEIYKNHLNSAITRLEETNVDGE